MVDNEDQMVSSRNPNHLTRAVLFALILGIVSGQLIHGVAEDSHRSQSIETVLTLIGLGSDLFLRLIKMVIAPLVLSTLVVGIAKMGHGSHIGRLGFRTMTWFILASILSLLLGLLLVNFFSPGTMLHLPLPQTGPEALMGSTQPSFSHFVINMVPKSVMEAMSQNDILQIVVFALFMGVACSHLGPLAKPMIEVLESLGHLMLKITSYIMALAPLAVFSGVTTLVAKQGLSLLASYGVLMLEFYVGLLVLWCLLVLVGTVFLGKRVFSLLDHIRQPMLLAFGTASSESAYPILVRQLHRFGCDERIVGFVLPLGYSFNLDGSMIYMSFAVMFIAQAYGIYLTPSDQLVMMLTLMVSSKGVAGVPRASLVVISSTLTLFHIPEAGLLLLLGIDQFLDMGRSATNVLGNSLAAAVVNHWECGNKQEDRL